jgi:eukaryotic-like serine/threonine-protein kinase
MNGRDQAYLGLRSSADIFTMELLGRQFGSIRVTDVIGEGGMGEVYAGYDESLHRKVALKVLHQDDRLDSAARERLLREAQALSKLDHPHICRIHDFIDGGDADLLVLEYIDGRTLAEAVSAKTPHAEKLRIAVSVAEVLVVAHRAGIIHRDLKPENVMLTHSGEVKVLDFGLAQWLHRSGTHQTAETTAPMIPWRRAHVSTTQAGTTVGTPLYMSPEQARGEPLTAASDLFALGLLLQHLFTGREPHPGHMMANEVMMRVALGKTEPVVGAHRDVAALINGLKMHAPADRPTAMETVERLRWIADKPRRIVRRAAIAAVAAFLVLGTWRYTVDLDRQRAAAVSARQEAERRRGQAENLIDFMMGDLNRQLEPIGHLHVLGAAADRAMVYLSTLRPEQMSAGELARNATVLQHLGEVRLAQGKLTDALQAFRQEQRLLSEARRRSTAQEKTRLLASHAGMARLLVDLGDLPAAEEQSAEAARLAEERVAFDPANVTGRRDLGTTLEAMAGVQRMLGRSAAADRLAVRAEALLHDAVRDAPEMKLWPRDLAAARLQHAHCLYASGDLDGARGRAQAVAASAPAGDPDWRVVATDAMLLLGRIAAAEGRRDAAHAEWERVVELLSGIPIGPSDLRLLDRHARALLLLGRETDARPLLDQLRRVHYANPDLLRLPRGDDAFGS